MDEAESPRVDHVGQEIQRRRKAIGIDVAPFAKEAGVSRTTVNKTEAGEVDPRDKSLRKMLDALDRLEHEGGRDAPERRIVVRPLNGSDPAGQFMEVEVQGRGGFRIIVRGPVDNPEALADAAERLMNRASAPPGEEAPPETEP